MRLQTVNPFPIPGTEWLQRQELLWSKPERAALTRAADILERAADLYEPESDEWYDLRKAEVAIREWLE